ncbi:MAG: hypothetical protein CL808_07020 [Citromicrobium sp.]|nr:hypothetical protein [Citromicrobium sp.]
MKMPCLTLALAASVVAVPAAAEEMSENRAAPVTVTVSMADLDLTQAGDRDRLERRFDTAIRSACRTGNRDLRASIAERTCRESFERSVDSRIALAIAESHEKRLATMTVDPAA